VGQLARLSGNHRTTLSRWLSQYGEGGLEELLKLGKSSGRPRAISPEIEGKLREERKDQEGFASYGEIQRWLQVLCEKEVSYSVVHKWVRYRLKGKLKVPRPVDMKQKEGAIEEFKKNWERS
jgi:transposase